MSKPPWTCNSIPQFNSPHYAKVMLLILWGWFCDVFWLLITNPLWYPMPSIKCKLWSGLLASNNSCRYLNMLTPEEKDWSPTSQCYDKLFKVSDAEIDAPLMRKNFWIMPTQGPYQKSHVIWGIHVFLESMNSTIIIRAIGLGTFWPRFSEDLCTTCHIDGSLIFRLLHERSIILSSFSVLSLTFDKKLWLLQISQREGQEECWKKSYIFHDLQNA